MIDIDGTPWECRVWGETCGWPGHCPADEEEDDKEEDMGIEKEDLARLALAEALTKACKGLTDPRGGKRGADNLRTEVDGGMRELYEQAGVKQLSVEVAGQQVGTLSARLSKGGTRAKMTVHDRDAFTRWLTEGDGADYLARLIALDEPKVLAWAEEDGAVPDGCAPEVVEEPVCWLGTTLRVDPEKVAQALGKGLPQAIAGLLGEGQ